MKVIKGDNCNIKAWVDYVPLDEKARQQLINLTTLPFVGPHVACMPDVHFGLGATVGSVIATKGAIIPASVGVDIGCGMNAVKTSLTAKDLPDDLKELRSLIEQAVPVGFDQHSENRRSFLEQFSRNIRTDEFYEDNFHARLSEILYKSPDLQKLSKQDLFEKYFEQMGTLGGGNHFIELCLDENNDVWVMLHSGSRGIGNCIGRYFIEKAKEEMIKQGVKLVDKDLAYLTENTNNYINYLEALHWAQEYAVRNRKVMMELVLASIQDKLPKFTTDEIAVNCHHNYVSDEVHYGEDLHVTRKGAVSAKKGELGIIPGSMGAKSFIVRGLGNEESFCSCSHGAGRIMSRAQAKREVSIEEHIKSTEGVECRKDESVIDETPKAYKNIEDVMKSQEDLVEIVHTLKQVLCVKG